VRSSITVWAMPGGTDGTITIPDAWAQAHNAGFDAVEATFEREGYLRPEVSVAELRTMAASWRATESVVSSLSSLAFRTVCFTAEDAAERQSAVQFASAMIRTAGALSIPTVSWGPGALVEEVPYDTAYAWSVSAMQTLAGEAAAAGVCVCIENVNNGLLLSPREFAGYLDDIGSPVVKACLDIGNSMLNGYPLHWIDSLNERIRKVHVTDARRRHGVLFEYVDIGDGAAEWSPIVDAVRRLGTVDTLTVEAFHTPSDSGLRLVDLATRLRRLGGER
jgi:L-ribulose-5-phosphate 3-epimerase